MNKEKELKNPELENENKDKKMLIFTSDGLAFAVDACFVSEIIVSFQLTYFPQVPSYVKGIINLRGKIVPVLDVRLLNKRKDANEKSEACIIVLDVHDIYLGLLVDQVNNIANARPEQFAPLPFSKQEEFFSSLVTMGETVATVFDCEVLAAI